VLLAHLNAEEPALPGTAAAPEPARPS
jgi:hypothetical protein